MKERLDVLDIPSHRTLQFGEAVVVQQIGDVVTGQGFGDQIARLLKTDIWDVQLNLTGVGSRLQRERSRCRLLGIWNTPKRKFVSKKACAVTITRQLQKPPVRRRRRRQSRETAPG